MDEKNICDNCGKALEAGGSIVLTPENAAAQKHLCISCFEDMGKDEKVH